MEDWPRKVADAETIIRGICSPFHVSGAGKLRPEAFKPPAGRIDVSVMRMDWIGVEACRNHAKSLDSEQKTYRGLAAIAARQIRATGADVIDTREVFYGHADIHVVPASGDGEPLPARDLYSQRSQMKALARLANYFPDPNPSAETWCGPTVLPRKES